MAWVLLVYAVTLVSIIGALDRQPRRTTGLLTTDRVDMLVGVAGVVGFILLIASVIL